MAVSQWRELFYIREGTAGRAWSEPKIAVASIAWTWGIYLTLIAIRLAIIRFHPEGVLLGRHCLVAALGAAITWCLHLLLRRFRDISVVLRIGVAMLVACPAAIALTLIDYCALYWISPNAVWPARLLDTITITNTIARTLPDMYFVLVSWAALYGSVTSALESLEAQRRAAVLQAGIHEEQLRVLRYQLNPHFLFNALNSLSALVMLGDQDRAERVIQGLSAFLRSMLEGETSGDATLAEELELQRLYLCMEQVRFGERLRVEWAVPDELGLAELPALLLQPIIENVLRHAVAPLARPVTMTIAACAGSDGLHVVVEDDGHGRGMTGGTGIGLSNVTSRLRIRYGDLARCDHGPRPTGGFRVEVVLPLRFRTTAA